MLQVNAGPIAIVKAFLGDNVSSYDPKLVHQLRKTMCRFVVLLEVKKKYFDVFKLYFVYIKSFFMISVALLPMQDCWPTAVIRWLQHSTKHYSN